MTEIIYKRGKRPLEIDSFPPRDETLKASLGEVLVEKIVVDLELGVVKRRKS